MSWSIGTGSDAPRQPFLSTPLNADDFYYESSHFPPTTISAKTELTLATSPLAPRRDEVGVKSPLPLLISIVAAAFGGGCHLLVSIQVVCLDSGFFCQPSSRPESRPEPQPLALQPNSV